MQSLRWFTGAFLLTISALANADGVNLFNPTNVNNPNSYGEWWYADGIYPSVLTIAPKAGDGTVWTAVNYFSCYSVPDNKPLNCAFTLQLVGVETEQDSAVTYENLDTHDIYGGHSHNLNQAPVYDEIDDGPGKDPIITVTGPGTYTISSDGKTVTGQTNYGVMEVDIDMPENAGSIWMNNTLVSPPGWHCNGGCFNNTTWFTHETWVVGFAGLTDLYLNTDPTAGYPYYVDRNPAVDSGHTDADSVWGLPSTVDQIGTIAQEYNEITPWNGVLGLNDMSLPLGGLFDIHDDWNLSSSDPNAWAHKDHRYGLAVDINEIDNLGHAVPCKTSNTPDPNQQNYFLAALYEQDAGPIPGAPSPSPPNGAHSDPSGYPVSLLCEPGNRIHVQINSPAPSSYVTLQSVTP